MRTKEVFAAALNATCMTQVQVAEASWFPVQSIGQKINVRESIKANEFFEILDVMGVDPVFIIKESGEEIDLQTEPPYEEKNVFYSVLKKLQLTRQEVSDFLGEDRQCFRVKIDIRQSIRMNEFLEILDMIGIDTVFRLRKTGEVLLEKTRYKKKIGERVVGMSDRIHFDTAESVPVASSFYADGSNEYGPDGIAQVLYLDKENRYFVAEYNQNKKIKSRVRSVSAHMAQAFIEKFDIGLPEERKPV